MYVKFCASVCVRLTTDIAAAPSRKATTAFDMSARPSACNTRPRLNEWTSNLILEILWRPVDKNVVKTSRYVGNFICRPQEIVSLRRHLVSIRRCVRLKRCQTVRPSLRLSASNRAASTTRIFVKFDIRDFYNKICQKSPPLVKVGPTYWSHGHFTRRLRHFFSGHRKSPQKRLPVKW